MSEAQRIQSWFYVDEKKERKGPFSVEEFRTLAAQGTITADTPIWTKGYSEWIRAGELPGLIPTQASTSPPGSAAPPDSPASPPETPPTEPAPITAEPSVAEQPPTPPPATATPEPIPQPASQPIAAEELKPRKGSFVFLRILNGLLLTLILTGIAAVALWSAELPIPIAGVVFLAGAALAIWAPLVSYRKERYELRESVVLCHRGGLVSDETTELEIRNITHVKVKLPWLRYKFFGVGNISIESAGNSQPVVLRSVREPKKIYASMTERMKQNGYALTQSQLLHEEKPALIGALVECLGLAIGGFFFVVTFLMGSLEGITEEASSDFLSLPGVLMLLGLLGALCYLVIHFLDFRRRTYRVYNDVVVYEEGFLTCENAFIPYENIADAATKRSFFDQILNLFDVVISCQGSSSEIKFRRLQRGQQLSECIDQLVAAASTKPTPSESGSPNEGPAQAAPGLLQREEPELVTNGPAWTADLRMNAARVLVPLLVLLPLFPLWVIAMIQSGITLMSTRYTVRSGSIGHSYRFLTTHDREFACEKITGLVIKENLWDRLFGTITLRFWSIGSGESLELAHVSRKQVDCDAIQRQIGIPPASPQPYEAKTEFGALTWVRAHCLSLTFALLVSIGLAVAAVSTGEPLFYGLIILPVLWILAGFVQAALYYKRQRLRFHDHHIDAEQGIIARNHYYARYRNVKKTQVTSYPGGDEGSLQIFVAGEQQRIKQAAQNSKKTKATSPCSFTLGFLPQAMEQGLLLDDILCGRVHPGPNSRPAAPLETVFETPRGVGNSVLSLSIWSVILVPLIVLLPLTIPYVIIATKKWRYHLDPARVIATWGILFKSRASVVLDRIDSLQQNQGPLNKMFKNGNVSIMTAGSSKPDLVLAAAADHQQLYKEIRQRSQGS